MSLNRATVRNNFYNFQNSAGATLGVIETWLANHIESPVAGIIEQLRHTGQPRPDDAHHLAAFVVAQLIRSPSTFDLLDQLDQHLGPLVAWSTLHGTGDVDVLSLTQSERTQLEPVVRAALAVNRSPQDQRRSQLRTLIRKADEFTATLGAWTWSVLTAEQPVLVLGDSPVLTVDPRDGLHGLLPAGSPVYLPITPTKVLLGEKASLGTGTHLSDELAAILDAASCQSAYDLVMSRPGDGWPTGTTLTPHRSRLPAPRIRCSPGEQRARTFPYTYPQPYSPHVRVLLDALEAASTVS